MKPLKKNISWKAAGLLLVFLLASTPLFAWYYFTTSTGERFQWVWGSSCNTNARPITVVFDSDTASGLVEPQVTLWTNYLLPIMNEWNKPYGVALSSKILSDTAIQTQTISSSAFWNFLNYPEPNQIWVVYDSDGSIFQEAGLDPTSGLLGIGLPLSMNTARPQDICSGVILMNGLEFQGNPGNYQKTLLHELGHVLGLAHSIAGGSGNTVPVLILDPASHAYDGDPALLPVMYPFAFSDFATGNFITRDTLHADDSAGIHSLYGP